MKKIKKVFDPKGILNPGKIFRINKALEQLFRHKVFKMLIRLGGLLAKGKITQDMIKLLDKWRHTGFNVCCGAHLFLPGTYDLSSGNRPDRISIKRRKKTQMLHALEWLAAICSHVPNKGEQMVRYCGHYSNVSRGCRKKARTDDLIPYILEPKLSPKEFCKNWARLIQKIYEVNPLVCPKCQGSMRLIAFIENGDVIKKDPQAFGGVGI